MFLSYLFNKYHFIKLLAVFTGLISTASYGQVIFSDNFDATPDWQSKGSELCIWIGGDNRDNAPPNYTLLYMTDKNPASPMCEITSAAGKGSNGKGIKLYDKSNGDKNSYGSDCQLEKYLGQQYLEIWVSYYVHYNPNMIWESGSRTSKTFRIGHYNPLVVDGTTKTNTLNTNNTSKRNGGLGDTIAGIFM